MISMVYGSIMQLHKMPINISEQGSIRFVS